MRVARLLLGLYLGAYALLVAAAFAVAWRAGILREIPAAWSSGAAVAAAALGVLLYLSFRPAAPPSEEPAAGSPDPPAENP